ncbi:MAG: terpene cyclase/mutase family protein [Planctomycetes bacterium]|nr:terpene cyclase/mutase family protein [Planctomycetota bacterium]
MKRSTMANLMVACCVCSVIAQPVIAPPDPNRPPDPLSQQPVTSDPAPEEATKRSIPGGIHVSAQNKPLPGEVTPELDAAVAKGLTALVAMQNPDGSFGDSRWGRSVAITSLSCLALMADGHIPGRGLYGEHVLKGLRFVLSNAGENGLIAAESANGPMYGHGFATLFLGEIYGMTGASSGVIADDAELASKTHEALVKAVRLIQSTQNEEGGWRYNPVPYDADVSVTICQVMGLRAARNAGLEVSKDVIDKAVGYAKRCQNADGGFRYQAPGGQSAWERSAAGVASLLYAGRYEDQSIESGLEYLVNVALPENRSTRRSHYFYGHYYAVQCMFLAGGELWALWWPQIREELIRTQQPDGMWNDPSVGNAYGTAMSLIILQMPKRYLPIFQK